MTWPVTPNPGIHQQIGSTSAPGPILTAQQIEAWAVQLPLTMTKFVLTALFNALEAEIPPALRGSVQDAENALEQVSSAVESALTAFPGMNLAGALNPAVTVGGTEIGTLLAHLGVTGLYDASQGFANQSSSLLKYLGTGASLGLYDASQGFANQASSVLKFLGTGASLGLYDASQGFGNLSSSLLKNITASGANLGQMLGTAVTGVTSGKMITDDVSDVGTAVENAAAGTLGTLGSVGSQVQAGFTNFLTGLYNNLTPPNTPVVPAASQAQVNAAAAAIQQRLAIIGNGAEEQVDVDFSTFSDGSLPSDFTAFAGASHMSISGGELVFDSTGGNALFNAATFLTDYQQVSGSWSSVSNFASLWARMAPGSAVESVHVIYQSSQWQMDARGSTGSSVWAVNFADTFTPGSEYTLVCGDPTTLDPYHFQLLKDGAPLTITSVTTVAGGSVYSSQVGQTYVDDTSHLSGVGGSFRTAGTGGNSASMSTFGFQDTMQSSPSVLVTTSEATSSTTYTDLPTISDEVAVNIGANAMAQVSLSGLIGNDTIGALSYIGFEVSGASAIAPSDDLSIAVPADASNKTQLGNSFLITAAEGLAPGLNVFKLKYKAASGTANFANRRMGVLAV